MIDARMGDSDDTRVVPKGGEPETHSLYGDELLPGALAGEYAVLGTIAKGGCGTVYSAEHRLLRRRAAVKVLHADLATSPAMVQRFVREARAVNLIHHPNIVDIYEIGNLDDGRPFFVMEFLDGRNLEAVLRGQGSFAPSEVFELMSPICEALEAAHRAGIIHRDLKASNVFIARPGLPWRVKLLDFGIAKLLHTEAGTTGLTSVGHRLGTPYSMAPEQIRQGEVDARTDVYALGVMLYHLLTGQYPFNADEAVEIERMHLEKPPPAPSQLAPLWPAVDAVVLRAMEKDPERRFRSARAFSDALAEAVVDPRSRRPSSGGLAAPAVGVYVDIRVSGETQESMDDSLLDDLGQSLDIAERCLRDAGLLLPIQTGSSLLGARALPDDPEAAQRERAHALETARRLDKELRSRAGADPRIHANICVHADRCIMRTTPAGLEIIGGPLVRIGGWAPQGQMSGVCATSEAVAGLSAFAGSVHEGNFVVLPRDS
jgi:serine/threonine-protein kinase